MKANKAKLNYLVDALIAIGFIISLASGAILLFNADSGYMGGRNPRFNQSIILFGKYTWKEIHNWSSLIMAAGVFFHFLLHWNWIVCMTKKIFKREAKQLQCDL